ncbi:protein of unknown function [Amycolatopsis pretoriensis]|uniref:DUF4192 domain-containing protein n=1 Tax=Amycolatopsis pretoriensis TaxID=218821 RepID=A0A1H5RII5_9PSEU|nr:DUF4192 domain-containing protein [Amycolatopsis pretoriensis]SEF38146.1 protein of unknown function [Amycolatopsis pretoriensis]
MPEAIYLTDADLLAAIPATLGYVPADSLVLVAATDRGDGTARMGPITRFDLDTVVRRPGYVVANLQQVLAEKPVIRLIGAVVHDNTVTDDLPYRPQLAILIQRLNDCGFTNIELLHLPGFTPGVTWSCYDVETHTGTLTDPVTSPVTTHVIALGNRVYRSRAEFLQQFLPAEADTRARIAALANPITDEVEREECADDRTRLRRRLDRLDDAVSAATGGHVPTDERVIADLLAALSNLRLRGIHLTQATAERAAAAHALWLHLWRHAPERYAPDMAALVATTAYLCHDGISAAAIFAKDPRPTQLSQLIRAMHRNGIDPATVDPDFFTISQELRTELTTSIPDL